MKKQLRPYLRRLHIKSTALCALAIAMAGFLIAGMLSGLALAPSYAETVLSTEQYKAEILKISGYIYGVFLIITIAGAVVLSLFYSHKVAGPFIRIQAVAREFKNTRRHKAFKLRNSDVIHDLADTVNEVIQKYGEIHGSMDRDFDDLEMNAEALQNALMANDRLKINAAITELKSTSDRLQKTMQGLTI